MPTGTTRLTCVNIRSSEDYAAYRDDPTACLHILDGDHPVVDGRAFVDSILWTARVGAVLGSTRVQSIRGSATVDVVGEHARIGIVHDSARIGYVRDHAVIDAVRDCARVGSVLGAARVLELADWASLGRLGGTARVELVRGFARLGEVGEQAGIGRVEGMAALARVTGSAVVDRLAERAVAHHVEGSARVAACGMAVVHAHGGTVTAAESATVLRYGEAAEAGRVTDTTAPATGGEGAEPGSATTAPALSELRQQRVHQSWHAPLAPCLDQLAAMMAFLRDEVGSGHACQPAQDAVLRAFRQPFEDVRVVIVGQDPYPAPGHAVGLSFSVAPEVTRLPGSLRNIFHEYSDDLGLPVPGSGDLTAWTRRGVLLLNRVLTVREGMPASHRGKGWEAVTDAVIRALAARPAPLVAILWGTDARALTELLGDTPVVASPHPSAMSAASGFFGSRPFSTANRLLAEQGGQPVDWRLP